METVKVSRKNQIAVPAAARRRLGIGPGDRLSVRIDGERLILEREPRSVVEALLSAAPELWQGIDATDYVGELREEWSDRERHEER